MKRDYSWYFSEEISTGYGQLIATTIDTQNEWNHLCLLGGKEGSKEHGKKQIIERKRGL